MKLCVAGGHITPAMALIEHALMQGDQVLLVGRTYASTEAKVVSQEKKLAQELDIGFTTIHPVKFNRYHKVRSCFKLPGFFVSLAQAWQLLRQEHPDAVISFGGFLGLPLIVAAWLRGIPGIIHEQTTQAGLANRLSAPFAKQVVLSYASSRDYFPQNKSTLVGNLIRPALLDTQQVAPAWLSEHHKPLIYITGGNQGSHTINRVVGEVLPQLLQDFTVVHQTGDSKVHHDLAWLKRMSEELPAALRQSYYPAAWFEENDVAWLLRQAFLVISRAGANTISELMVAGVPAILIPLMGSQKSEQLSNAQLISKAKAGLCLNQEELTPESILTAVKRIEENHQDFLVAAQKLSKQQPQDSVPHMYKLIKRAMM